VAMAERIAANSPRAVQAIKDTIELALPVEQAQVFENQTNRDIAHTADSVARFRRAADRIIRSDEQTSQDDGKHPQDAAGRRRSAKRSIQ